MIYESKRYRMDEWVINNIGIWNEWNEGLIVTFLSIHARYYRSLETRKIKDRELEKERIY